MSNYTYDVHNAYNVINTIIADIKDALKSPVSLRLSHEERSNIVKLVTELDEAVLIGMSDSSELYGMYNKLFNSLPKYIKDYINTMHSVKDELRAISTRPSLFLESGKILKESGVSNEYEKIYQTKFIDYYKKILGQNIDIDIESEEYKKEFYKWLARERKLLEIYQGILQFNKLGPGHQKDTFPIELFKGKYDTLKSFYPARLSVYSRYGFTITENKDFKNVYSFDKIDISKKNFPCPVIIMPSGTVIHVPIVHEDFHTYFTHNPYNLKEENMALRMLQNDQLDFTYGLFGYTHEDENIDSKISELLQISKDLPNTKVVELKSEDGTADSYHMAVVFKPKKKKETN